MKGAVVTQWVRAASAQVPPDQSLASTSVVNSTCKPSNGSTRLEGSRIQAASLSPEIKHGGQEDIPQDVERGKPTASQGWKATVPDTLWRVEGTPPGSVSGACISRGNSGTWESPLFPCAIAGLGDRVTKSPGMTGELRPAHEPAGDTTNEPKHARYREASDKRSDPRRAVGQS